MLLKQNKNSKSHWFFKYMGLLDIYRLWKKICHMTNLFEVISFLATKFYFTIGHLAPKEKIGIPMNIDPTPYWVSLFLYLFEFKYIQQLISKRYSLAYKFHGTSRFIDDNCTVKDDGEFSSSYKYIYPSN